jgi:excinuclease UvrABC nuclease subunit
MSNTALWLNYDFLICDYSTQWNNSPGIYIFAGLNERYNWVAYYVGQADNFQNRIPSHEKWELAQSHGATHVHVMEVLQESDRDMVERRLIQACQPILNDQLK